jgi:maleylacetate reductase
MADVLAGLRHRRLAEGSVFPYRSTRVVFGGQPLTRLAEEVAALGVHRAVVLTTPRRADTARRLAQRLGPLAAGICPVARMHVPEDVVAEARGTVTAMRADGCVAYGGGSAIGLAKALARDLGLPCLAVPTTYSGSEMTDVWGTTTARGKTTGRGAGVRPGTVLYEPALPAALPARTRATSGCNALAHAVEALYAPAAGPVVTGWALEATARLGGALPALAADRADEQAQADALYGAWLAGMCLDAGGMGLHHRMCHVLGGLLDLPHAGTHTVVLPYALAFLSPAVPAETQALAAALGGDPPATLQRLARGLGAPRSLAELGMRSEDVDRVAREVAEAPYPTPRKATGRELAGVLRSALTGADVNSTSFG